MFGYLAKEILQVLQDDSYEKVTIFLGANKGALPSIHPYRLKNAIQKIIPSHDHIDELKLTRQGKLLTTTSSLEMTHQILDIQELGEIPVSPIFQRESITTRFLLHDIPTDVSCREITVDLIDVGIYSWENGRFTRNIEGQI